MGIVNKRDKNRGTMSFLVMVGMIFGLQTILFAESDKITNEATVFASLATKLAKVLPFREVSAGGDEVIIRDLKIKAERLDSNTGFLSMSIENNGEADITITSVTLEKKEVGTVVEFESGQEVENILLRVQKAHTIELRSNLEELNKIKESAKSCKVLVTIHCKNSAKEESAILFPLEFSYTASGKTWAVVISTAILASAGGVFLYSWRHKQPPHQENDVNDNSDSKDLKIIPTNLNVDLSKEIKNENYGFISGSGSESCGYIAITQPLLTKVKEREPSNETRFPQQSNPQANTAEHPQIQIVRPQGPAGRRAPLNHRQLGANLAIAVSSEIQTSNVSAQPAIQPQPLAPVRRIGGVDMSMFNKIPLGGGFQPGMKPHFLIKPKNNDQNDKDGKK